MTPLNKILLGMGAALVASIAMTIVWLSLANAHLKTQLAQSQANATSCHIVNDEFASRVLRQNATVQAIRESAAAHEKQAQHLSSEAAKVTRRYRAAADKLRQAAPQGNACRAADILFNHYLASK